MAKGKAAKPDPRRLIADNKRAKHKYEVTDTLEAGIALVGTEVKTLRDGKVSLDEAYARIDGGELYLIGAYIPEYTHGNRLNHDPTRKRKLLVRKREIRKLFAKVTQRGLTLVPLRMFWSERNLAKVEVGVCRGRKVADKRQHLKSRDADRETRREHGV